MSDTKDPHDSYAAGSTGGTATAPAKELSWDEQKAALNPFEQKLSTFINRRINAQPNVTVSVNGRKAEAVEYLPGGAGLGRMKVLAGAQTEPEIIDVDETTFEMLLAKIVNV